MIADALETVSKPILSSPDYATFKQRLSESNCPLCPLSAGRTHIVVDRGNPEARVLIVGEAPGEQEDLAAKAFVGRSGKLLDRLMAEQGFVTDRDALIANIAKCRPPQNRPPTPLEAKTCLPYLRRQIELLAPHFMILLGATAVRHMLPAKKNFSMAAEVGALVEVPEYPGIRTAVFYHPAYILRDPRKTPAMQQHIRNFLAEWRAAA